MRSIVVRRCSAIVTAIIGLMFVLAFQSLPIAAAEVQDSAVLEQVVVTARRVEERLQDTPIAVSAFQSADIEKLGIRNIGDAAAFTPNFISNPGPTGGNDAFFFIRGVGQTDLNPATDPGVGTYIDGVYLGRVQGASMDSSDVARIEVLRGPQGTLFGRNTVGGAINITTRDPGKEFGAEFGVSGGSRSLKQARGSVDVPLGDAAGLLLSANYREQDGWGRRLSDGKIFDSNKSSSARVKFKWEPGDTFSLTLSGDYSKLTGTPQHSILVGVNTQAFSPLGIPLPAGMAQFSNPSDPYINNSDQAANKLYKIYGTGLNLAWKLGWAELRSITSYRKLDQNISTDYDSTPFSFYQGGFVTGQKQWSQELQLSGDAGRAKWLLGAFYYKEKNQHENVVALGGNNGCLPFPAAPPPGGFPYPVCDFAAGQEYATAGVERAITNHQQFMLDVKAQALFGQTTIQLSDRWSTTLGLRWTKETKEQNYNFWIINGIASLGPFGGVANLAGFPPAGILVSPSNPEGRLYTLSPFGRPPAPATSFNADWSQVTPKVGIEFKPAENQLYYFSYSKGFKSGGFAGRPSPNQQGVFGIAPYDPEKMDSYELGAKTQFADDRVRVNLAVFQSNYKGIQLLALNSATGFFDTLNAAESRVRGAELELQARPIAALQIQAGLGYTNDQYRSLLPGVQAAGIRFGMHLPLTPRINGSLGAQYTWKFAQGAFTLRGDYVFRTEYWYEAANTDLNRQGGFGLANARATYQFSDDQWSIAAYGLNLGNKFYKTNVQDVIGGGLGIAFASVSPPREYGAEVRYRFGSRR